MKSYKELLPSTMKEMFKLIEKVGKPKKVNEKILDYLQIYTHLIMANFLLKRDTFKKALDQLQVIMNLTKQIKYKDEEFYLMTIRKLVKEIISKQKRIARGFNKDYITDPGNAKVKLQLAQNICVLRVLR